MIALACDHSALDMKQMVKDLLDERGLAYRDFGTDTADSCDYPVYASRAARGIVICGTGIGVSMAANKVKGVRCALCGDSYSARLTRLHNDSNVLALGARVTGMELARAIAETWLTTPFSGEERHRRRIALLTDIENGKEL